MRVLLVSANRLRPSRSLPWNPVPPLGAAYVASALRRRGHEAELLDLCFADSIGESVSEAVGRFSPDCVGISIRNLDTMAYFNPCSFASDIVAIAEACRSATSAPIVLGGSGFSVMPRELLDLTGVDAGIVGEGEDSFPELLDRMEAGEDRADVPGVVLAGGRSARGPAPRRRYVDLSVNPRPARDLLDSGRYAAAGGLANVQTKRGCPFACVYCTYPLVEGADVRTRPAADVAGEMEEMHGRDGVRAAYVVDSQFNYPLDHARAVCEELVERRDRCRIGWACMVNPKFIDDELVLLMRAARCVSVDLSVESASDAVLEGLGKNFSTADIRRAIEALDGVRLPYAVWILLGGPGETAGTVVETLDFLERANVREVLFAVGLRICPGTSLERRAIAEGKLAPGANLLAPRFYLSMDPGDIVSLVRSRLAARPGWRIAALAEPFTKGEPS